MRVVGLGLALLTGCGSPYVCSEPSDCIDGDVVGVCQGGGACSFPDPLCESGQRYGGHSGSLAGMCVPPEAGAETTATTLRESSSGSSDGLTAPDAAGSGTGTEGDATASLLTATTDSTSTGTTGVVGATDGSTGDPIDPSLLLWLTFEGGSIDTALVNYGILGGAAGCDPECPDLQDDLFGGAAVFGAGKCATFPSSPELIDLAGFTVAAWIWRDTTAVKPTFLSKPLGLAEGNTWEFYSDVKAATPDVTAIVALVGDGVGHVTAQGTTSTESWRHAAMVWEAGNVAVYIDGVSVASTPAVAIAWDDNHVRIGCDVDNGTPYAYWPGLVDDVRIYARALDGAEISVLAGN